jgi:hypothetical protein
MFYVFVMTPFEDQLKAQAIINIKLSLFYFVAGVMFAVVGFALKGIFKEASIVAFVTLLFFSIVFAVIYILKLLHVIII